MNFQKELNRITSNQVDRLKKDGNVIGVLLFGSAVSGGFDEFSDIDLYCITSQKPQLSRESLHDAKTSRTVEILYDSLDDLTKYISEERYSTHRTISSMLASGKVVYEVGDEVKTLVHSAAVSCTSRTELTKHQSTMLRYSLEDFYSDAQREFELKHIIQFNLYAEKLVQNAIEASLIKRNGYFDLPKRMVPNLQTVDATLHELLLNFYQSNFDKKLEILQKIKQHALELLGGELPEEWSVEN